MGPPVRRWGGYREQRHAVLWLALLAAAVPSTLGAGYVCPPGTPGWPCLRGSDGKPMTIRVQFMEKQFVTVNTAAVDKASKLGIVQSCTNAALALPECFNASNWNGGWLGKFMNKALEEMGVNVIALTTLNASAEAKAKYKGPSSFTRCVWDVKLGHVDLCVGDFWETFERRNLSVFTTPLDSDSFTMYTTLAPGVEDEFTYKSLMNIFQPFDNSVWMLLAVGVIFNGIAMWLTEYPYETPEYPRTFEGMCKSVYYSSLGVVGEDLVTTVWPSRIICMGFMFFIYIHVNSYLASLATTLVTNAQQLGDVSGLQDLILQGKKLCLYQSMAAATSDIIGNIVQTIEMDNYGPMLEKLYQRDCAAAVVGKFESTTFITASNVNFTVCTDPNDVNNYATCANSSIPATNFQLNPSRCAASGCKYAKRFCKFVALNDPTISQITLAWELPVSKELEPWVSAAILKLYMEGYLSETQLDQLIDVNPVVCPPPQLPSLSLRVSDMSGTYFFSGTVMILGVAMHLINLLLYYVSPAWRRYNGLPDAAEPSTHAPGGKGDAAAAAAAAEGAAAAAATATAAAAAEHAAALKHVEDGPAAPKARTVEETCAETEAAVRQLLLKIKRLTHESESDHPSHPSHNGHDGPDHDHHRPAGVGAAPEPPRAAMC